MLWKFNCLDLVLLLDCMSISHYCQLNQCLSIIQWAGRSNQWFRSLQTTFLEQKTTIPITIFLENKNPEPQWLSKPPLMLFRCTNFNSHQNFLVDKMWRMEHVSASRGACKAQGNPGVNLSSTLLYPFHFLIFRPKARFWVKKTGALCPTHFSNESSLEKWQRFRIR